MATVKELEARVAALEIAFAKRVAETEELRRQCAALRADNEKVEAALAAKPAASAKPAARSGASQTYATVAEAMAAGKALAVAGKHRVCVTGCVVTAIPR